MGDKILWKKKERKEKHEFSFKLWKSPTRIFEMLKQAYGK
jgi:hypothetical protein